MLTSGKCRLLGSLSRHSKDLEWRTLKPPGRVTALGSWTDHVIALRQITVTALFYLEDSRRVHPWRREESGGDPERGGGGWGSERERESPLPPLFRCCFLPPGPALCKLGLARSAVCSTWGPHSGPQTFLCSIFAGLFPSLSFSHRHFGLLVSILTT